MKDRRKIPSAIAILFAIDIFLCLSYGLNFLIGGPSDQVTRLLALDGEMNIPTWYSSMQWLSVAFLLGIFACYRMDRSNGNTWILLLFPLMFLAFSIDEVACVHEWLGKKSDVLLPTGHRGDTFFRITGIWFLVLGVPVLSICLMALSRMKKFLKDSPRVIRKMGIGIIIFFGGALGVEVLSNIPAPHSSGAVLENMLEEGMEMAGVTVLLWASYDLLLDHGFTWHPKEAVGHRTSPAAHVPEGFTEGFSAEGTMRMDQIGSGRARVEGHSSPPSVSGLT